MSLGTNIVQSVALELRLLAKQFGEEAEEYAIYMDAAEALQDAIDLTAALEEEGSL